AGSEARRVADLEGAGRGWPQGRMPARAGARLVAGGVPAQPSDHRVGVSTVAVDGDPLPGSGIPPPLQAGRVERRGEKAALVKHVVDRAGAVVAAVPPAAVAAARDAGLGCEPGTCAD